MIAPVDLQTMVVNNSSGTHNQLSGRPANSRRAPVLHSQMALNVPIAMKKATASPVCMNTLGRNPPNRTMVVKFSARNPYTA